MATEDIISNISRHVDDALGQIGKDARDNMYPSEVISIGILLAPKGASFGSCIPG